MLWQGLLPGGGGVVGCPHRALGTPNCRGGDDPPQLCGDPHATSLLQSVVAPGTALGAGAGGVGWGDWPLEHAKLAFACPGARGQGGGVVQVPRNMGDHTLGAPRPLQLPGEGTVTGGDSPSPYSCRKGAAIWGPRGVTALGVAPPRLQVHVLTLAAEPVTARGSPDLETCIFAHVLQPVRVVEPL